MKDGPLGNSFRDPSGFIYLKNGVIYRQINNSYRVTWEQFISSGLYDTLIESGDLISHEFATDEKIQTDDGWLIIKPEPVEFWSYPYEWCFSQLKDAALTTLRLQSAALRYGMSMKDASAYNVQFIRGRPVLIDSLSFEKYDPAKAWKGFRQFCMHFLAPLALMSMRDHRLGQLFRIYMDGIPLELASSLLPWKSWSKFFTLIYIHLHAKDERRHLKKRKVSSRSHTLNIDKVKALVENLESAIDKLDARAFSSWVDYYSDIHYGQEAFLDKEKLVRAYIEMVAPRTVWDFGANNGHFSRIAAKNSSLVVAFDFDMAPVELNSQLSHLA
jgi:hypothetical protein